MAGLHLPDTDTVDDLLVARHLSGLTVDQLLSGLGVSAGTTIGAALNLLLAPGKTAVPNPEITRDSDWFPARCPQWTL